MKDNKNKVMIAIVAVIVLLAITIGFFINSRHRVEVDTKPNISAITQNSTNDVNSNSEETDVILKPKDEAKEDIERIEFELNKIDAIAYAEGRDCGPTTYKENGYTYRYSNVTHGYLLRTDKDGNCYQYIDSEWEKFEEPTMAKSMPLDKANKIVAKYKDSEWLYSATSGYSASDAFTKANTWLESTGYLDSFSSKRVYSHKEIIVCLTESRSTERYLFISTNNGEYFDRVDCSLDEFNRFTNNFTKIDYSLSKAPIDTPNSDSMQDYSPKYFE